MGSWLANIRNLNFFKGNLFQSNCCNKIQEKIIICQSCKGKGYIHKKRNQNTDENIFINELSNHLSCQKT